MAAGVVQLPVDGAGKKLAAQSWTQGADGTVYGQKLIVCDAAGSEVTVTANQLKVDATSVASTATLANVSATTTTTTLLASNANRLSAIFSNDADFDLYVKFGATASATSWTYKVAARAYLELPLTIYRGVIDGIWDATSGTVSGAARVTELTI